MTRPHLIQQLSTVVDPSFARGAVESYIEMEQRFLAGDWQPAELDGGRLCEAISRALLQMDTGKIDHNATPGDIRKTFDNQQIHHNLMTQERNHITKAIEAVYKLRSQRGSVHISPTYFANSMDSMFVLYAGKWIFAEFLRLAWNQDRDAIAAVIEQLVQMEYALIHELDGKPLVLVKDVSAPEEVLLLLGHASGNRASRADLIAHARNQKPATVRSAINSLVKRKEARVADNGEIALAPPGSETHPRDNYAEICFKDLILHFAIGHRASYLREAPDGG